MIKSAYRLNNAGQILITKISPTPAHPSSHQLTLYSSIEGCKSAAVIVLVKRWLPPFNFLVSYHAVGFAYNSQYESEEGEERRREKVTARKTAISPQNLSLSRVSYSQRIYYAGLGFDLDQTSDYAGLSAHETLGPHGECSEHCISRVCVQVRAWKPNRAKCITHIE